MLRTLALFLVLSPAPAVAAELFVAPHGSDTHPGSKERPFATIARARDEIRQWKKSGQFTEPVTITLQPGVYRIAHALEFTADDSGSEKTPITYAAAAGGPVVISGGQPITGWQKGPGQLWQAKVADVAEGRRYFHQLFVNGQRRVRARTPNVGYLYTADILSPFNREHWSDPKQLAKQGFVFRGDDIRAWKNPADAMIVLYHSWTTSIHYITAIDAGEHTVRVAPPSTWPIGYWWESGTRYHVENIAEALDAPGEWYLDRSTGLLSYWPMPGEDMAKAEVVAPMVRPTLLSFQGDPANGKFVEHLRFVGLSLQHADCDLRPDMPTDQQGATERPAVVAATGLRHARFENVEIAHIGENAVWLDRGCSHNTIRRCHLHDLGASAIFIGPKSPSNRPELQTEYNVVDNCFLHDGSHIFRGSQGVWIGRSSYNEVTHNEICDFHHLGISVGHSWGYAPSSAHHNLIAFNHVHHICNGYFSDGGAIYTLGISPGTVIRNNIIHDVVPTPMMPVGGTGIYHDEGSTGILVEDNIVYRVGAGAYNQHYGRENIARNNIFAFGGKDTITCCRPEEHLSFTFEGNIVLCGAGWATSSKYSPLRCKTAFNRNLYWDVSGKEPVFSGSTFAEWQKSGRDRDSRIADPQFVDTVGGDFRLRPTSPALAMGFRPIATDKVGLYGDAAWVNAPKNVAHSTIPDLPPPPPPLPARPLVEGFELLAAGKQPAGFNMTPPARADLIQASADTAATGKQSLKFTKVAGLKHSWEPHLYFSSERYQADVVRFACDLRQDAAHPADCYLGLRDWGSGEPYREGPSLAWKPDGALLAGGKALTRLPLGQWVHFEITLTKGTPAKPATYRLTLTVAGQPAKVFADLPVSDPKFEHFTWFGFSSCGEPGSVFYLDNIRLECP